MKPISKAKDEFKMTTKNKIIFVLFSLVFGLPILFLVYSSLTGFFECRSQNGLWLSNVYKSDSKRMEQQTIKVYTDNGYQYTSYSAGNCFFKKVK